MATAGAIFIWYEWGGGRELVNYETVIVLNEEVKKGDVIYEENISFLEVDKESLIKEVLKKPNTVIGQEAKHYIPANTQLHNNYFEEGGLLLKKNQFIAKIPLEWTLAVPDTLRRGDSIVIYAAMYDQNLLQQLNPSLQNPTINNDDEATELIEPINSPYNAPVKTENELTEVLTTTVAYVKDSSNREVVTVSLNDRLDGSSTISGVEIITTTNEFKKIEDKINKGGKLIIMYSDYKFEEELEIIEGD